MRSGAANSEDVILCDLYTRNAVHAVGVGKANLVIGFRHDEFIHVSIELLVGRPKFVDPTRLVWASVLAVSDQPEQLWLPRVNIYHQK